MNDADRDAVRLAADVVEELLERDSSDWHRGLSGVLTAARTQLDAAVLLSEEQSGEETAASPSRDQQRSGA
jgi:hypothetical protein